MDDVLKRRLIGAAVVLAAAFLLVTILPRPEDAPPAPGQKVVNIDLRQPPTPAPSTVPAVETPLPPVIAAASSSDAPPAVTEPAANEAETPELGLDEELHSAKKGSEQKAPPEKKPVIKEPVTETSATKPALKMDSTLSAPKAAAKAPAAPPAQAAAKPESKPAVPEKPKPVTAKASPAAPAKKPVWHVQAGSFSDIAKAREVLPQLKSCGYAAIIAPSENARGTRYRVLMGPYASKDAATAIHQKLAQQKNCPSSFVVQD